MLAPSTATPASRRQAGSGRAQMRVAEQRRQDAERECHIAAGQRLIGEEWCYATEGLRHEEEIQTAFWHHPHPRQRLRHSGHFPARRSAPGPGAAWRSAALPGAGHTAQDGVGERPRGALGARPREGRLGQAISNGISNAQKCATPHIVGRLDLEKAWLAARLGAIEVDSLKKNRMEMEVQIHGGNRYRYDHCRVGTQGMTRSTKWATVWAIRRLAHDGQTLTACN